MIIHDGTEYPVFRQSAPNIIEQLRIVAFAARNDAAALVIDAEPGGDVVVLDTIGELARLFAAAEETAVNLEDVRIEHSPGLPVGVAELSVRPDQAGALLDAMEAGGWPVRR